MFKIVVTYGNLQCPKIFAGSSRPITTERDARALQRAAWRHGYDDAWICPYKRDVVGEYYAALQRETPPTHEGCQTDPRQPDRQARRLPDLRP